MINPMMMMQMKEKLDRFREEHPKVVPFLQSVKSDAMTVGSVIELKVTTPDGREKVSNIKVKESDVDIINTLMSLS